MKSAGFPADEALLDGQIDIASRIKVSLSYAGAVVSAPETRTRQSAELLATEFAADSVLRDVDYGRWAGLTLAGVQATEAENLVAWVSDVEAAPHGGESIASAIDRIGGWLAGQKSAGGHTIVVTHPSVIRAAVLCILDAPKESFWKIDVQPWSLTELTSDGRRWALRSFGHAPG
jgi:broad specificity phosphatase PhoE